VAEEEERTARDGGVVVEKKTTVGDGGRGCAVHRCSGNGEVVGVVLGRGDSVDPTEVEAVEEAPVWTWLRWRRLGGDGVDSQRR
jgi:hypothetical protein